MGVFFFISGLFVPASIEKRGTRTFLVTRFNRLVIPAVLYILLFSQLAPLLRSLVFGDTYQYIHALSIGPMWFTILLFIFDWLALKMKDSVLLKKKVASFQPLKFVLFYTACNFLWRLLIPLVGGKPLFFPAVSKWFTYFLPSAGDLPQYALFFLLGLFAVRTDLIEKFIRITYRKIFLLLLGSLLLYTIAITIGKNEQLYLGGLNLAAFCYSGWQALWGTGMTILLIKFAKQKNNGVNQVVRKIMPLSFTVYVIHLPIILSVAVLLEKFQLFPVLNAVLATVMAFLMAFLLAFLIQRIQLNRKK